MTRYRTIVADPPREWQTCPVCRGYGILPHGFYSYPAGQGFTSNSTATEHCKRCQGSGTIVRSA